MFRSRSFALALVAGFSFAGGAHAGRDSAPCIERLDHPECDQDNDGLTNTREVDLSSNPIDADTDDDGVDDGVEADNESDPSDPCRPYGEAAVCDQDQDGLPNGQEEALGSSSVSADSDGDGVGDGVEVFFASNPIDPCSPSADVDVCHVDVEDAPAHAGLRNAGERTFTAAPVINEGAPTASGRVLESPNLRVLLANPASHAVVATDDINCAQSGAKGSASFLAVLALVACVRSRKR